MKKSAVLIVLAAALSFYSGVGSGEAQSPPTEANTPATVTFQFDRMGVSVPRFTMVLREDGSGTYHAEEVERRSADQALQQVNAKLIDRKMMLTTEMTAKIFRTARKLNRFTDFCGTKVKNIADTGTKTLSYVGADGVGSCTYNFSDDKNVTLLTDLFYSIAYTMDIGRKLDFERRFDRLGLDAEMIALEQSAQDKNALELGTIASTLTTIAGDQDLIQRVRMRAAKLLEQASANK